LEPGYYMRTDRQTDRPDQTDGEAKRRFSQLCELAQQRTMYITQNHNLAYCFVLTWNTKKRHRL